MQETLKRTLHMFRKMIWLLWYYKTYIKLTIGAAALSSHLINKMILQLSHNNTYIVTHCKLRPMLIMT